MKSSRIKNRSKTFVGLLHAGVGYSGRKFLLYAGDRFQGTPIATASSSVMGDIFTLSEGKKKKGPLTSGPLNIFRCRTLSLNTRHGQVVFSRHWGPLSNWDIERKNKSIVLIRAHPSYSWKRGLLMDILDGRSGKKKGEIHQKTGVTDVEFTIRLQPASFLSVEELLALFIWW